MEDKVQRTLYYIIEPGKKPKWKTEADDYPYGTYYELSFSVWLDGTIECAMTCPYKAETPSSMKEKMLLEIERQLKAHAMRIANIQRSVERSIRRRKAIKEKGVKNASGN